MNKNRGFAVIYVLFIIFIFFAFGTAVSYISLKFIEKNDIILIKQQAFYIAESGIELAKNKLKKDPLWNTGFTNSGFTDISGETIGYFTVIIDSSLYPINKIISVGYYKNYIDTIILTYTAETGNHDMFNCLILADSGVSIDSTGSVNDGKIHSNSTLNTSSIITYTNITFSSVALGDTHISKLTYDTFGYYTEAAAAGQSFSGYKEFLEGSVSSGIWYVNGDVTIGGVRWWNKSYKRRMKLRITNNNTWWITLPSGYSVNYSIDTNSLINSGMLRPDLNDLRVVRYNTATGVYTELNRVYIDRPDMAGLWFRTMDTIASSLFRENYYIYYNNPAAGAPPANPNNVFIVYDDFSINSLGNYHNGRHLNLHGAGQEFMIYDNVNLRLRCNTGDNNGAGILTTGLNEQNVLVQCDIGIQGVFPTNGTSALSTKWRNRNNNTLAHISNGDYASPQIGTDGDRNSDIVDPPGNFYIPADGSTHTLKYASGEICEWFGNSWSNYYFWVDNILHASSTWNNIESWESGEIAVEFAQQIGWMDNLFVRRFISPEPSVTLRQEGNTTINGTLCATGDIIIVGTNDITINNSIDTYPALLTNNNIYFNGTNSAEPNRPYIEGIIFADKNIYIDNIRMTGSIYGQNVQTNGNISISYNTNPASNPYLNPPPYFKYPISGITVLKWLNNRFY
ncbi:hypothetical protein KA977_09545 [Candidatus Dependentiae bacterium]|nr:hypothetical protein [Candidatus Dependentiae bacterium]